VYSALLAAVNIAPDTDAFTAGVEAGVLCAFVLVGVLIGIATIRKMLGS
jgi:tetrahydromethanopterin S-methyltransferase subunit F